MQFDQVLTFEKNIFLFFFLEETIFSRSKFIKTRLDRLTGSHVKLTKYQRKVFMVPLGKLTAFIEDEIKLRIRFTAS